jgi:hypothetical protein
MDKKTMESLRAMLCEEIEDIAKKGNLGTHETLDILKDLIETEKNLGKIEHYDSEKEMKEGLVPYTGGYSQRKYYIDADYQPTHSYRMPMYDMNSYGTNYVTRSDFMGNSYVTPSYERSYTMSMNKQDIITELKEIMNDTKDEEIKKAIQKVLTEMNK